MTKYIKKYWAILTSIILLVVTIYSINYAIDLSKDYKNFKHQYINEKQNYVFLGDSITNYYDLDEYYDYKYIVNSGIGGDQTTDILKQMKERVYDYNPTKVILLIGINDMASGRSNEKILRNIESIVLKIKKNRPYAKIYVESVYPLSKKPDSHPYREIGNKKIQSLNKNIKDMCIKHNLTYINVYDSLTDEKGYLKDKYTEDGLHLNGLGYHKVTKVLNKYVNERIYNN